MINAPNLGFNNVTLSGQLELCNRKTGSHAKLNGRKHKIGNEGYGDVKFRTQIWDKMALHG